MLAQINHVEDYHELMKLCVIILIIIGRKTASSIPLCAPHAPFHLLVNTIIVFTNSLYFWDKYVITMDFYWTMYDVGDILHIFVSFLTSS